MCPTEVSQGCVLGTDFLKAVLAGTLMPSRVLTTTLPRVSSIESFLLGFPASSAIIVRGGTAFAGQGVAGTVSWLRAVLFLLGSHRVARLV